LSGGEGGGPQEKFDYDLIARHAKLIVDARGRYPAGTPNVVPA